MPLIGVVFFFSKSPRYIPEPIIRAKIYALFLLTIVLPILLFFLLKSRGKISSIYLPSTQERILPLLLNIIIVTLITRRILPSNELLELHYFFIGILFSTMTCLVLALLKFKASIHMIAAAGVLMFFIALSIHYNININGSLAIFFIITGAIATSRLHLKAHSSIELLVGFLIGFTPQLILLNYWL
jgi:membrane-associated HD superfamily phosphohydrolase